MTMPTPEMGELQPDTPELLQQEVEEKPGTIPVCVHDIHGPVRVQLLPRKGGGTRTAIVTTTPKRILTADHRRYKAVLSGDGDVLVAFSQASAQDPSTMATAWSKTQYKVTATVEVWARAVSGTVNLGITTERWAEGD